MSFLFYFIFGNVICVLKIKNKWQKLKGWHFSDGWLVTDGSVDLKEELKITRLNETYNIFNSRIWHLVPSKHQSLGRPRKRCRDLRFEEGTDHYHEVMIKIIMKKNIVFFCHFILKCCYVLVSFIKGGPKVFLHLNR